MIAAIAGPGPCEIRTTRKPKAARLYTIVIKTYKILMIRVVINDEKL
jgi:hypothetical protein